jgi:hypothetical protein
MHKQYRESSNPCLDMTLVSPSVSELCIVFNLLVLDLSAELSLQKTQEWPLVTSYDLG